jgi:CspA family cold shock protein
MSNGTVKWFNETKGYGFITPEDGGKDVFVHITALDNSGIKFLKENDKISYEVSTENGKISAKNLKKIR